MPTVSPETAAYGGYPSATVSGANLTTAQTGIAGTVGSPVTGSTSLVRPGNDLRMRRMVKHRLNRTIASTATAVGAAATVAAATDAIQAVRAADRRPSTLVFGKRTGRIRRLEMGAVDTLSTLVGGTLYSDASYTNVPMVLVTGNSTFAGGGLACDITVASGIVTACTITSGRTGRGYTAGMVVTAIPGSIGVGTLFSITIATVVQG